MSVLRGFHQLGVCALDFSGTTPPPPSHPFTPPPLHPATPPYPSTLPPLHPATTLQPSPLHPATPPPCYPSTPPHLLPSTPLSALTTLTPAISIRFSLCNLIWRVYRLKPLSAPFFAGEINGETKTCLSTGIRERVHKPEPGPDAAAVDQYRAVWSGQRERRHGNVYPALGSVNTL